MMEYPAGDAVPFEVDSAGCWSSAGAGWHDLAGVPIPQILGRPWIESFHPGDRPRAAERLKALLESGRAPHPFEVRLPDRDCRIEVRLERTPASARGLLRDVTELRKLEERARSGQALLEAIQRAQMEFLSGADSRGFFSRILTDLLGLTASEYGFVGEVLGAEEGNPYLRTHAVLDIGWDEETRRFYQENASQGLEFRHLRGLFEQALETGKAVISEGRAGDQAPPPGHPVLRTFLGIPLYKGERLVGMAGLANRACGYDAAVVEYLQPLLITCTSLIEAQRIERRRQDSAQTSRRSAAQMRAILQTAADGVVTFDGYGIVQSFNPAAEQLFRVPSFDVIGRRLSRLLAPPFCEEFELIFNGTPAPAGIESLRAAREVQGLRKDDSTFPFELAVTEVALEGRRLFTAMVHDLTERRKIDRIKNEFISTVSHELRTPLTSIRGSLGLLAGGVLGAFGSDAQKMLEIALRNTDRLVRLINDILDLEKIESGRIEFRLKPQDLRTAIRQGVEANRGYAHLLKVRLEIGPIPEGASVLADPDRLMQILTNLISNAAKFSPAGEAVTIGVERADRKFRILVRDRGPGIPEEFHARIFQRFAQADSSNTRPKGGTGLGLNICKALVERMGGTIGFETCPGQGSTFHFDLPEARIEAESPLPAIRT